MLASPAKKFLPVLITSLCIVVPLSGCNEDKAGGKAATQVAAKVNGAEISVHQINALLSKAQGVTNENAPLARKEILSRLIDQQLAVEQALGKKLDRNPEVLMSIEAARRDILARAYVDQVAAAQPKVGDAEIQRYYDEHPDLFAKRRIYNIQELAIPKNIESIDKLKELVSGGKNMDEIASWLKSQNIAGRAAAGTRPAEQLPLELLPKLAQIKDGQTALIDGPQQTYVMRVVASQLAPVDEPTAKARIQQFLQNQANAKAVGEEMKKLKDAAKIEFIGDFAAMAAAATTPPATSPAPIASEDKAAEAKPDNTASALEKGVAGLK